VDALMIDDAMNVTQNISRWYVIHTGPKQEIRAFENLRAWGLETFFPRIKTRRLNQFTGSATMIPNPLFPRYIFARFAAHESMHKVRFTRGVSNIVEFGNGPCAVDEEIISILKSNVGNDGFIRMSEELKSGDHVVVSKGPLRNLSGVFVKDLPSSERVLILLNAIRFQGNLVVPRELVQRVA